MGNVSYVDTMREALIVSNVELSSGHDSSVYAVDKKKLSGPNDKTVIATEKRQSATTMAVADWHLDLSRSINKPGILTDEERAWIKFAYAQDRTSGKSEVLRKYMTRAFNRKFVPRSATHKKISNMMLLAVYCMTLEITEGKKVTNRRNIAECIGVTPASYKNYWHHRYEWVKNYLRVLDDSAVKSLAEHHCNDSFMQREYIM